MPIVKLLHFFVSLRFLRLLRLIPSVGLDFSIFERIKEILFFFLFIKGLFLISVLFIFACFVLIELFFHAIFVIVELALFDLIGFFFQIILHSVLKSF